MKNLALMMMISVAGVALSAEEYTIQTISALKESSITPAFEKKVQKSALPVTKKKEGACNVVTVGRYDNPKTARADLAKAKAVAKDAFVRPMNRTVPKACAVSVAENKEKKAIPKAQAGVPASVSAQPMAMVADKPKETAVAGTAKEAAAAVVAAAPSAQSAPNTARLEEKKGDSTDRATTTTVFIYDRNLARKSDIHDAIEYYKNSPYHTFKPVAMQK